jgi:hypothetical protein
VRRHAPGELLAQALLGVVDQKREVLPAIDGFHTADNSK